jgi:hypothetical protein
MRILVVEDDLKVGAFLEQELRDEAIQVDRAYDSPEALSGRVHPVRPHSPDHIPTRTGIEVALSFVPPATARHSR